MKPFRLCLGLFYSFLSFCFAFAEIALSPLANWTPAGVAIVSAITIVPVAFSFRVVYSGWCSDDMYYWTVAGIDLRPAALKKAVLSEICLIFAMAAIWIMVPWIMQFLK